MARHDPSPRARSPPFPHCAPREIDNRSTQWEVDPRGWADHRTVLELHQEELFALPPPVFHALLDLSHAGRCWNDLRVILLVHDKRLLALLSGARPTLLEGLLATLPCPQARARCRRILRECIVPTVSSVDVEKPQPLPKHGFIYVLLLPLLVFRRLKPCS